MKARGVLWLKLLAAVILSMAAITAARGATLVCYIRNRFAFGLDVNIDVPAFSGKVLEENTLALPIYLIAFGLTLVWAFAVFLYIRWAGRNWIALATSLLPMAIFAWAAWNTFLYAYPVCNAF